MSNHKLIFTTRLILTGVLIYFVYFETGVATTIFAVLVALQAEGIALVVRNKYALK